MNFQRYFNELGKLNWNYIILIFILLIIVFTIIFIYNYDKINRTFCGCTNNSEQFEPSRNINSVQGKPSTSIKGEVILYYASWCGYSRQFLPEWDKFEKYVLENIPQLIPTKIRCESDNEALCMQKGIEGYPMVILYPTDNAEVEYNGPRTAEGLIEFVRKNLLI